MSNLLKIGKISGSNPYTKGDVGVFLNIGFPRSLTGKSRSTVGGIGNGIIHSMIGIRLSIGNEVDQGLVRHWGRI